MHNLESDKTFLNRYNLTPDDFEHSGMTWGELQAIVEDHETRVRELTTAGNHIVEILRQSPDIHSIRLRIKDPEHLVEKVLRKRAQDPQRVFTVDNYRDEITDLIGVRGLHLHKEQWPAINDFIYQHWGYHNH